MLKFKRIIQTIILFCFICPQSFGAGKEELQLRSLLPNKRDLINLVLSKDPDFYSKSTVSRYLKERKNLYLEYGVQGLLVTSYYKAGEIITVEIYKMTDYKSAYGLFTVSKVPSVKSFKVGDGSIESSSVIVFWQSNFFVKMVSLGRLPGTMRSMERLSRMISKSIGRHKPLPFYVKYLPEKGLNKDSIKLIKGPVGFNRYFSFSPETFFTSSKDIHEGVTARYKDKGEYAYCLLRYWSESKSMEVLDTLLKNLKSHSVEHYYLFDVLFYKMNHIYFKIDRIENYISIITFPDKDFNYGWFIKGIKQKITG